MNLIPKPHEDLSQVILTDAVATQTRAVAPVVVMPVVTLHDLTLGHGEHDEHLRVIVELACHQISHDTNLAIVPFHQLGPVQLPAPAKTLSSFGRGAADDVLADRVAVVLLGLKLA